jgi:hypothetical protein
MDRNKPARTRFLVDDFIFDSSIQKIPMRVTFLGKEKYLHGIGVMLTSVNTIILSDYY